MRRRGWWNGIVVVIGKRFLSSRWFRRTADRLNVRWAVCLASARAYLWLPWNFLVVQLYDLLLRWHTDASSDTLDLGVVSRTQPRVVTGGWCLTLVRRAAVGLDPAWAGCFTVARTGERWKKALHRPAISRTIRSQACHDGASHLTADGVATRGTASTSVGAERAEGASAAVDDVDPIDVTRKDVLPPRHVFEEDVPYWLLHLVFQQILELPHSARVNGRDWDNVWKGLSERICCFSSSSRNGEEK